MKRLRDLSPTDLDRVPIWRYHGETDDQAVVEPDQSFRDDGSEAWIAKTEFILADGTVLPGYCSPIDDQIDYVQPVLICGLCHVPIYSDAATEGVDTAAVCARLGRRPSDVFPIRFMCEVPLPDGSWLRGLITPNGLSRTD